MQIEWYWYITDNANILITDGPLTGGSHPVKYPMDLSPLIPDQFHKNMFLEVLCRQVEVSLTLLHSLWQLKSKGSRRSWLRDLELLSLYIWLSQKSYFVECSYMIYICIQWCLSILSIHISLVTNFSSINFIFFFFHFFLQQEHEEPSNTQVGFPTVFLF